MKQTELAPGISIVDGDSDSDNPNTAVVLGLPDKTIADVEVPGTDKTVADYNLDYDPNETAVTVAFESVIQSKKINRPSRQPFLSCL